MPWFDYEEIERNLQMIAERKVILTGEQSLYIFEMLKDQKISTLIKVIKRWKKLLDYNNISVCKLIAGEYYGAPYAIMELLTSLKMELTLDEKKMILLMAGAKLADYRGIEELEEFKKKLDLTELANNEEEKEIFQKTLDMISGVEYSCYYDRLRIEPNSSVLNEKNMDLFEGLDEIIEIDKAMDFYGEKRDNLLYLCKLCPNLKANYYRWRDWHNDEGYSPFYVTGTQLLENEDWMKKTLGEIQDGWNEIQKSFYIGYKIREKYQYAQRIYTEINSEIAGDMVCAQFSKLFEYMMRQAGYEASTVISQVGQQGHAISKIKLHRKNEQENDEIITTLCDFTFAGTCIRWGMNPFKLLFKSYEEMMKIGIFDCEGISLFETTRF